MLATGSRRIVFTGEQFFLRRHRPLIDAVAARGLQVELIPLQHGSLRQRRDLAASMALFGLRAVLAPDLRPLRERVDPRVLRNAYPKSPGSFLLKSQQTAGALAARTDRIHAIVHVFCLSSPFIDAPTIPYAHYLDYTYALSMRNYPSEPRPFPPSERQRWLDLERRSYARAERLYAMSSLVRDSLIHDYGVDGRKIAVVGSGGNFAKPSERPKTFGSRQLLFNASDFHRKGGDAVMSAFASLYRRDPSLRLVTVGKPLPGRYRGQPGVIDHGPVPSPQMLDLFESSDLVLAPARCDPFPGFVIEAMNAGAPPIVTARDAMPEIVTDGIDGVVLPDVNPALLASAALSLVNDPDRLRRLSEAGRQTIRQRLNWSSVADKMMPFLLDRRESSIQMPV